ncbi:MAG: hypothetical protein Q4F34_05455 [Prevotellaceae bacterium]|nr:hypothetical protein [Prevotellaceae bacterium]
MKETNIENNSKLSEVKKGLMKYFITMIVICLIIVVLFETGALNYWKGEYASMEKFEFIMLTAMEIITIASIPFALKFLKFKFIQKKYNMAEDRVQKYKELALLRMEVLILPMIINIFCYYLFKKPSSEQPSFSFGYLAIIVLVCLCFISPTMSRCERETAFEEEKENGEKA